MSIIAAELKLYRSGTANDLSANGGRMSAVQVQTDVKNNLFPDVTELQRLAGVVQYRKGFWKIAHTDYNNGLDSAQTFLKSRTPGDDIFYIFAGSQTDLQSDISSPDLFGVAALKTSVTTAGSGAVVTLDADEIIYRIGDNCYITDGTNSEIKALTNVVKVGTEVTLTFDGVFSYNFSNANTVIASILELTDECVFDLTDISDVDGVYSFPLQWPYLILDNIGGIYQTWTIVVAEGGSTFSCTGDTLGEIDAAQSVSANYAPSNPDFLQPYFTILSSGWTGEAGTMTFKTKPAAAPVWFKRVVPVATDAETTNTCDAMIEGEGVDVRTMHTTTTTSTTTSTTTTSSSTSSSTTTTTAP